jgi:transketolase
MRAALSDALVEAARRDPRFVLITGDHGYALFDAFRAECPDRYINAGIAEQNMVGIAAGMAMAGYRPAVYGLSAFVPIRVLEQIKMDVCYLDLPVLFLGDGAGIVYSTLGSSHQSTEDISAVRALPGITVLSPADRHEMTATFELATSLSGPTYMRIGKADRGDVHPGDVRDRLKLGHMLDVLGDADAPLVIIATGSMVVTAREVSETLSVASRVLSAPSLKPLDVQHLVEEIGPATALVTMEEHSIQGGLGSIIAEQMSEVRPMPILRIGVPDQFSTTAGSYEHLMREHGLDAATVLPRVASFAKEYLAAPSFR